MREWEHQQTCERNAYQLITTADGERRIAVSTPLDAYNPGESGRPRPRAAARDAVA